MNILFLTLLDFNSVDEKNIYTDLLRVFVKKGHDVSVISPVERRNKGKTYVIRESGYTILKLKIGNMQKTNVIEKGISTLMIENLYKAAIKKYFSDTKFDMVLYSTPPITFVKVIEYVKKRDGAISYLMLKDIFPQNAVDLDMFSKSSVLYWFFRAKERKLYKVSDQIGCMSPANVKYVIRHNPQVNVDKVRLCPNCIDVVDVNLTHDKKQQMRAKYGIPDDKKVFVYGGNLGKPQGINFIIDCLKTQIDNNDAFFLIVGNGTEYGKLEQFFKNEQPMNMKLMQSLPKADYDRMIAACDVGMIFLDHRFTIPNFPSRLLSYMQAQLPVLACTDQNTDIGEVIETGGFGMWCESNDTHKFATLVQRMMTCDLSEMKRKGLAYLLEYYTPEQVYSIIVNGELR